MEPVNFGGHLSLGRKATETVREAAESGFTSMQIFASSPGAWKPPVVDPTRARSFVEARDAYGVNPLFIHAIYLINLASVDPVLARRSADSLRDTLAAAATMGAGAVITHIGSHAGRGFEAVVHQVGDALREILMGAPSCVSLALENSAGAGGTLGADMVELAALIDRAGHDPRLGIALDTAHLTGAGWDFTIPGETAQLTDTVDREIGLDRLMVIHANDSAVPVGSRKDRHANIGEGHIGVEGFEKLLAEPALRKVPWIMETPDLGSRAPGAPSGSLTRLQSLLHGYGGQQ